MLKYLAANMGKGESGLYPAMQLSHSYPGAAPDGPLVGLGWHTMSFGDTHIIWHNGGTGGYRSFAGFINGGDKGVVVLTNSDRSVDDIGIHILHPESPMDTPKPSIGSALRKLMDEKGITAAEEMYRKLKETASGHYDFGEPQLNTLGYTYLAMDSLEKALAAFKLNLMAYPGSSNVYDSYGEALLLQGDTVKAIENYRKSVELNPGNTQGVAVLKALGEDTDELLPDVEVDPELLERYVGQYELMPGFILTVTREGNQLKAQATGQQQFDIFPRSDTVFYWRVVEAQLTFILNADGAVERVTLLQNGQELVGKRAQY
jgi:tetratricopeptide (TPR) repeat protein